LPASRRSTLKCVRYASTRDAKIVVTRVVR
jgi:hypothetical protein